MSMHIAYGGAQLLRPHLAETWRKGATRLAAELAPDAGALADTFALAPAVAEAIWPRVHAALHGADGPLRALRIDFEDGYGVRPDAEEDAHAAHAGNLLAALGPATLALGLRVKPFSPASRGRALRTLEVLFEHAARAEAPLPALTLCLPKLHAPHELSVALGALSSLEARFGLAPLALELMVETPHMLQHLAQRGLTEWLAAGEGRVGSLHFGAYDALSALGVPGPSQSLAHPHCDALRTQLLLAAAAHALPVYDGATVRLPLPLHRGAELDEARRQENLRAQREALREHAQDVRRALEAGCAGSWDLHPAQLLSRYVATSAFYLHALPDLRARLGAFLRGAAQASAVGQAFDDAASARGLLSTLQRGLRDGLLQPADVQDLPVPAEALAHASFDQLVQDLLARPAATA